MPCDQCKGKRYNRETLEIKYKGKTIHEVLDMTIEEAREFFDAVPALARKLQTLMDVGLTYIRLGQSATTLSGGEAQRVKLAREAVQARYRPDAVYPR
ncbi:excinuclease ABC subunit A [Klebsiella pneumoniae]|uniref:UvrABC system protein A n=1 Tax=Klebsiella pneumoniae TaxID=573 RepID=A0A377ZPM1_KLEPN|nr:excinuclease ABC subunit A [Klebsiella pneumoniae]